MAMKHLELGEMAGLSAAWVGAQRPLLQAIPQAAAWLPQLDEAHARVVKAQPISTSELDAEIAVIVAKELVVDLRHDDLIRCSSHILEAEQCLCRASDPPRLERAALCERALSTLLPRGLLIINALYVAEAGNAARTRELLASEAWLRELLASIPTSAGGTLLTVAESWCALGEQLGKLEEQKAAVQARISGIAQPPRAEMLAARNGWLAIVNMILMNLDMVEGHQQAIETLRAPVLRTAEVAGKRHTPRDDEDTPAAPAAPAAPAPPGAPAAPAEPGLPGAKPFALTASAPGAPRRPFPRSFSGRACRSTARERAGAAGSLLIIW